MFTVHPTDRIWISGRTFIGRPEATSEIADMLRYDGAEVEQVLDADPDTLLYTAVLVAAKWTPERWRTFGFESAIAERGEYPYCTISEGARPEHYMQEVP